MQPQACKVAAAHVAPVFLDREATLDKACALIREAARHGAQLIVFPETYIPAFPLWCALQAPIENHALFCQLAAGSLRVDGPEIGKVADAARPQRHFRFPGLQRGLARQRRLPLERQPALERSGRHPLPPSQAGSDLL